MRHNAFPNGLISVLQCPFMIDGRIDFDSLGRLVHHAMAVGVDGFLAPVVASETAHLTPQERRDFLAFVISETDGRVPVIAGASANSKEECIALARHAEQAGAAAYLVAVPDHAHENQKGALPFFQAIGSSASLPMLIQDLRWNSYGLDLNTIETLWNDIPALGGFKVETVPAGPKYSHIRARLGDDVFLCGGWAVPQLIEAMDRGVNAMAPESSMIPVYRFIMNAYAGGDRLEAMKWMRRLSPVLSFTNQELGLSIAFFKKLLVKKNVFERGDMRFNFEWDPYNLRIADELIDYYVALEDDIRLSNQRES